MGVTAGEGARVAIAFGSNLGDREAAVREALRRLADLGVRVEAVSTLYESAPAGFAGRGRGVPWFVNGACVGRTSLDPESLLAALQRLERELGRTPEPGLAPRPIDLDLILYDDRVVRRPGLTLPHPRFRERAFVLWPLREVAPDWRDPVTGRTVAELAQLLPDPGPALRPLRGREP